MAQGKALLIKSYTEKKESTSSWHRLEEIEPYIMGIKTGDITSNVDSTTLNDLISGVPTPWARAKLFWFSFKYLQKQDANIQTSGLVEFYKMLLNEWKGLIAMIALFPDRIHFSEPIYLENKKNDLFDISDSFGRMLFDEKDLWSDLTKGPDAEPFTQLIYYGDEEQLIGATSPYSIIFTSVDYSQLKDVNDIRWYRNGKFEDPLPFLNQDQIQKLYLVIKNITDNFRKFESNVYSLRSRDTIIEKTDGITNYLYSWQNEIKRSGKRLLERGPIPKIKNLSEPFAILFNSEQKVYQRQDTSLSFEKPAIEQGLLMEIKDLQYLLKEDEIIIGWPEVKEKKQSLKTAAVHLLAVNDPVENNIKYFPLPLSFWGLKLFRNKLKQLIEGSTGDSLRARITEHNTLLVEMTIIIDGTSISLNPKEYKIQLEDFKSRKIVMWPNFISAVWKKYYLYSEFPSNLSGLKYYPFYKEKGVEFLENNDTFVFSDTPLDEMPQGLSIETIVNYPVNRVPEESHKYEVIRSNKPIAGLLIKCEVQGKMQDAGFLVIKVEDESMGSNKIRDYSNTPPRNKVIVGIDFGSTNTCVNYSTIDTSTVSAIPFTNRRVPLVGVENLEGGSAEFDELLFFQNEEVFKGQIKSWLHEHDKRYIKSRSIEEISGGVPIYEKNIAIMAMDKFAITTQAGVLHYNLKWLSNVTGTEMKTAYIRTIWAQICADLYANQCYPTQLKWSFPGAFSTYDKNQHTTIFETYLPTLKTTEFKDQVYNEFSVEPAMTESEAVFRYALTQTTFSLGSKNIFLGIDIGGSTSDILLMAQDPSSNNKYRLFSESSIRLAAGVFFDAIIKSNEFRKVLVEFYNSNKSAMGLKIENIENMLIRKETSPFYLNSIFDQLKEEHLPLFYAFVGRKVPFVFSIPAYVTGLLLYYSGKLTAKLIENNFEHITNIDLLPFGKGGRIFQWMDTFPGKMATDSYYKDCFLTGLGEKHNNIIFQRRTTTFRDNKSEVSIGLVAQKEDLLIGENIRENSDIFAEKGVKLISPDGGTIAVDELETARYQFFYDLNNMKLPDIYENFNEFLDIFLTFSGKKNKLIEDVVSIDSQRKLLAEMLKSYLQNDTEYIKAKNESAKTGIFEFKYPLLIAEGMCFLEKVLIPEVFKT